MELLQRSLEALANGNPLPPQVMLQSGRLVLGPSEQPAEGAEDGTTLVEEDELINVIHAINAASQVR